MSERSTRIWLDEVLWEAITRRALADGTTVRDLIPDLVGQALSAQPATAPQPAPAAPALIQSAAAAPPEPAPSATSAPPEPGPPVVALSEVYRCAVCGAEVRLGGLSNHMGKHLKERQAAEVEGR